MGKKSKNPKTPSVPNGDQKPPVAPNAEPETPEKRELENPIPSKPAEPGSPATVLPVKKTPEKPATRQDTKMQTTTASNSGTGEWSAIRSFGRGLTSFFMGFKKKQEFLLLSFAIIIIGASIVIALWLGQETYLALETNASNAGHLYGIVLSSIVFFFFARYLRSKKDILYVRRFIVLYFVIYFCIVMLILAFLQGNLVWFLSTLGNSFILFSAFTLIIFILSPEILGVLGGGGGFRKLFLSGHHVRVIIVYLFIALMQVTGFSLLDSAIQLYSTPLHPAYVGIAGDWPGTWFDFFYFSTITFATIGYGDIHPALPISQLSSTIQALLSHVISILFLAVLLLYLSSSAPTTDKEQKNE